MKKFKMINLGLLVVILLLEIFGKGATLYFGNPEGADWKRTFSYFSLTPFGYANFGPFITALLTCVLLLLVFISLFKISKGLNNTIFIVAVFTCVISFSPLLLGLRYYNIVSLLISILLVIFTLLSFYANKNPRS